MDNLVILKGYSDNKEVYAVKKEYSIGFKTARIIEVPTSPEVKKLYSEQKSKFTKRKNWGLGLKKHI